MTHRVESLAALEALYDTPLATSVNKEIPRINGVYRRLIEAAPFVAIASIGPNGMDCSPRGDEGMVAHILDPGTLAIPDRRGNNRLDTLRNIVADPRVGLLFLIPGLNETLRVNGRAHLSTDPALCERFAVHGKLPVSVIVVEIDTLYFQCARALKRAHLWAAEARPDPATLPRAGELVRSAIDGFDADAYDAALQDRQARTLY